MKTEILRLRCAPLRMTVLGLLMVCPVLASAGGDLLGTKSDPVGTSNGGGVGLMPMLQMLLALGIVLVLLKVLMPKLVGKFGKKLVTKIDGGIKIEESANFPGGTLYVVKARKKTILISVAQSGVTCLTDLSEPEPEVQTFQEMVDHAVVEIDEPVAEDMTYTTYEATADIENADTQRALDRLQRLAG